MSWNLVTSASWNPKRLSRPVQGLPYLYLLNSFCRFTSMPKYQIRVTKTMGSIRHWTELSFKGFWRLCVVMVMTNFGHCPSSLAKIRTFFSPSSGGSKKGQILHLWFRQKELVYIRGSRSSPRNVCFKPKSMDSVEHFCYEYDSFELDNSENFLIIKPTRYTNFSNLF
jgi:hypothetical protein